MRFRQTLVKALRVGMAVAVVTAATVIPLLVGGISFALTAFAPWFVVLQTLGCRGGAQRILRAVLQSSAFGFAVGGLRAMCICGPIIVAASERPLAALLVAFAYSGAVHAMVGCIVALLLRGRGVARFGLAALTVPALDLIWCGPASLYVPYMTAAYVACGSDGLLRAVPILGPTGLAGLIGIAGAGCATLWARGTPGRLCACAILAAAALADAIPPASTPATIHPPVTVMTFTRAADWSKGVRRSARVPDLVVLPESSVIAPPAEPVEPGDIPLDQLRRDQDQFSEPPAILAGVHASLSDVEGNYRNRVLFRWPDGREAWVDKRIQVPGGEITPFRGIPLIGWLCAYAAPTSGRMLPPDDRPSVPVQLGSIRLAVAVCYDHNALSPGVAWGADPSHDVDLLVCVARSRSLGEARLWERRISARARRLHSALFRCPVLYVTDFDSEVTMPSGGVYCSTNRAGASWAIGHR